MPEPSPTYPHARPQQRAAFLGHPVRVDVVDGDVDLALRRLKPALAEAKKEARRAQSFTSPGELRRLAARASRRRTLKGAGVREKRQHA